MNLDRDWSDWLPPMLIKEIRQGLRNNLYVLVFCLIQFLFMASALIQAMAYINNNDMSGFEVMFLATVTIVLCLLFPLRSGTAISSEVIQKTIELIHLTSLTPFRIIFGKWFSGVVTSLLFTVSLLPYLTLRYYFGGLNLVYELAVLVALVLISGLLTAICVFISSMRSIVFGRIIGVLFILALVLSGLPMIGVLASATIYSRIPVLEVVGGYLIIAVHILILTWVFLEIAATYIAPLTTWSPMRKRLIGVVLILLMPFAGLMKDSLMAIWLFGSLSIYGVIIMDAYTEEPTYVSSLAKAWRRIPIINRMLSLLFYPGWPTALIYHLTTFLLLIGFASAGLAIYTYLNHTPFDLLKEIEKEVEFPKLMLLSVGLIMASFGFFAFPVILMVTVFKKFSNGNKLPIMVILQSFFFFLAVFGMASASFGGTGVLFLLSWIPSIFVFSFPMIVAGMLDSFRPHDNSGMFTLCIFMAIIGSVISMLVLLFKGRNYLNYVLCAHQSEHERGYGTGVRNS